MTAPTDPNSEKPSRSGAVGGGRGAQSILSRISSDDLLRHTGILFSGMILVHICSLVFQMAMFRALPDEEYKLLAAFLATLAIIQRPLTTLNTGVSHYSSLLHKEGRSGDIKRLLRKWLTLAALAAAGAASAAMLFRVELADFLEMGRTAPVVIMAGVFPALFCMPLLGGAVQGLQLFTWRSAGMSLGAVSRVALGAGFVWFLYPACGWAMLGHGLGVYVAAGVFSLALLLTLRGAAKSEIPLPSMRFYLLRSFFIQAAYAVLMTADVVLVSHHLPEDVEFAKAATIGRLVVFLPGAIAIAMFPKVTSGGSTTHAQRIVFLRSLGYTALCVAAGVVICWLAGGLVAKVLGVPEPSDYLKRMIGLMGTAMGFSAMLNVLLQFLLAQRRFGPAYPVIVFAVGYLATTSFFNGSAWEIGMAAAVSNAAALIALLLFLWRKNWFAEQNS